MNLNGQLIADTSLANRGTDFKTSFNLNTEFDRNAVSVSKIRNFNFSAGTGGTIVLGGVNNGNGLLRVKNSSGGTIVTVNNQGISVTNGSITVINSTGGTVLDSAGIVSSVSFPNAQIFSNSTNITASTSPIDVPGASLNSFVLTRTTNVYITMSAWGYNINYPNGNGVQVLCVDSVDGTLISYPVDGVWAVSNVDFVGQTLTQTVSQQPVTMGVIEDLSAGTHTIKLRFYADGGGTATLNAFLLSYFILGS